MKTKFILIEKFNKMNLILFKSSIYILLIFFIFNSVGLCGDNYCKPNTPLLQNYFSFFSINNQNFYSRNYANLTYPSVLSVCPQPDITISTSTTWSNGTMELCPNQRIIIESGATLTLTNYNLKAKNINPLEKWDGVTVKDGSSLIMGNNSFLQQSTNGIIAEKGFNIIRIIESKIIDNDKAIFADESNSSSLFPVYLLKVTLSSSSSSSQPNLVILNGANLYAIKCNFLNPGNVLQAIVSFNNRLTMQNCLISGFDSGINKNIGAGFTNSSLNLDRVDILNAITSIDSRDINLRVSRCILSGVIRHSGTANGSWISNNFINGRVFVINPSLSQVFKDNRFGLNSSLRLFDDQSNTDATCNYWDHCNEAVSGKVTAIKGNWGSFQMASGNYHTNCSTLPTMSITQSNPITHYYRDINSHNFDHQGQITGTPSPNSPTCLGQWRPYSESIIDATIDAYTPPSYNDSDNNEVWISHHEDYIDAMNELNGAPPSSNPALKDIIENSLVGMGQCFTEAMAYGVESMTSNQLNTWISRADPLLERRSIILQYLSSQNYSEIINYLNSLNLVGFNSNDRYMLRDAMTWIQAAIIDQKDIFHLSSADLSELMAYANTSFGDYTEVLRGWLSIHYNILINYPLSSNLVESQDQMESSHQLNNSLILNTNSDECIVIYSTQSSEVNVEVIGMDGRLYYSKKLLLSGEDCIRTDLLSGLYLVRITGSQLKAPLLQTYFIR